MASSALLKAHPGSHVTGLLSQREVRLEAFNLTTAFWTWPGSIISTHTECVRAGHQAHRHSSQSAVGALQDVKISFVKGLVATVSAEVYDVRVKSCQLSVQEVPAL